VIKLCPKLSLIEILILLDDQVKKKKEVFESKCRVWKLKEEEIQGKVSI